MLSRGLQGQNCLLKNTGPPLPPPLCGPLPSGAEAAVESRSFNRADRVSAGSHHVLHHITPSDLRVSLMVHEMVGFTKSQSLQTLPSSSCG